MGQLSTWADLSALRLHGLRPELPVFVTDRWRLAANMRDIGCVAILHRSGQPMPVRWLHGLDVLLDFDHCETAGKVARLMRERGVRPRFCRAWCKCARDFVATCGACDDGGEPWAG
jgi:hypothetical protein